MKKILMSFIACLLFSSQLLTQEFIGQLTFTAVVDNSYIMLDSIKVMNSTQGGDTSLVYPDTVLVLDVLPGMINPKYDNKNTLFISQNHPNPFKDKTSFAVHLPERNTLQLVVYNLLGQKQTSYKSELEAGHHDFLFYPGKDNYYIILANSATDSKSIRVNCLASRATGLCKIEYAGESIYKSKPKALFDLNNFAFELGDELLYIGYANFFPGTLESGLLDSPEASEDYVFQFATNIPCPGTPTVTFEGQVYNTIQILNQCWLKENLNVGTMVNGNQNQQNNMIIEKYCYDNDPVNCISYGGLYQWDEVMQYSTMPGEQGICPLGWHVPTNAECMILEGTVDSQYGIGDPEWDSITWRGFDVGLNLKSINGWNSGGNGYDDFSFTALPSGYRNWDSNFINLGFEGNFWTSNEFNVNDAWRREYRYNQNGMNRNNRHKSYGFSCRCLKD